MKHALKRAGVVALIALLAVGAASGAVTFDEETTNTATTSDVSSTSTALAYNASDTIYLEAQTETTTPAFELVDPEANETLAYRNGTDLSQTYSDTSTSPSTYYYSTNVSQTVLSDVEMAAGENKTIMFRVINNESASNPTVTEQNVTVMNDENRTFLNLEDSEVGSSGLAQLEEESTLGAQLPWNTDVATIDQSVPTNGAGTVATIDVENSTVAERLATSAEGASSGEWTPSTIATVDDEPVRVYADSAPSDASGTYIVHDTSADELEIHFGDDYSGSSSDVRIVANKGWGAQFDVYGLDLLPF